MFDAVIFMLAEAAAKQRRRPVDCTGHRAEASASSAGSSYGRSQRLFGGGIRRLGERHRRLFQDPGNWEVSDKPHDAIKAIALQLGFTEDSFDAALKDSDLFRNDPVEGGSGRQRFRVEGTPTFYVNGKQMVGEQTIDELSAAIDPLLG